MKTQVLTCLLSVLMLVQTMAQRGMGLTRNPEKLRKVAASPNPNQGVKSMIDTPLAYDLSAFAPPAPSQGSVPSCVAWSTAYSLHGAICCPKQPQRPAAGTGGGVVGHVAFQATTPQLRPWFGLVRHCPKHDGRRQLTPCRV